MSTVTKEAALEYHREGRPGKIEVVPTKPYATQHDLALAYSPGVAYPCKAIEENPEVMWSAWLLRNSLTALKPHVTPTDSMQARLAVSMSTPESPT